MRDGGDNTDKEGKDSTRAECLLCPKEEARLPQRLRLAAGQMLAPQNLGSHICGMCRCPDLSGPAYVTGTKDLADVARARPRFHCLGDHAPPHPALSSAPSLATCYYFLFGNDHPFALVLGVIHTVCF